MEDEFLTLVCSSFGVLTFSFLTDGLRGMLFRIKLRVYFSTLPKFIVLGKTENTLLELP